MDGHCDLRCAGRSSGIRHCVSEDISDRLSAGSKCLYRNVGVINSVRVRTIGCDCYRAKTTCDGRGNITAGTRLSTCEDSNDRLSLAITNRINVGIIGQHIACWICTGCSIADSTSFDSSCCIENGGGSIVSSLNGHRDLRSARRSSGIRHRIRKNIGNRLSAGSKCLNCSVGVIDGVRVSAVGCDSDRAVTTCNARGYVATGTGLGSCEDSNDRFCFTVTRRVRVGIVG